MLSVGLEWPQLRPAFRNAKKGVAGAQTSIPFRNAIKFQCCSSASGLIRDAKMAENCASKDWYKNGSQDVGMGFCQ